jgi:competence protein ComEC
VRRTLERGARPLAADDRALFTGLVVGDDREQSPEVRDDFLGSGLAHLLAVSGQNVAFVLALLEPIGNRLGPRLRLVLVGMVLLLFATITRFEPSVLRATAMAGLIMTSTFLGRPVSSIRVLCLSVCGLLLLDPFLVRSLGFGLSVSASAGIVLVGTPVARVLPGPHWLARSLGVIVGAQLGVAPLLLMAFGGIPVAALPANLLAEPVAGLAMMWGASAGLLAGVVPDVLADLIHRPTALAMWWIGTVARASADAGLGELGAVSVAVAAVAGVVAVVRRARSPRSSRLCAAAVVVVLVVPAVRLRLPGDPHRELAGAGVLSRSSAGTTLAVEPGARPTAVLRSVRRAGVDALDRLVLPSGGSSTKAVAALLARRIHIAQTVVDQRDQPP